MVSVITTKELRAGDFLLRYEAKAFEDDIPGISPVLALLAPDQCLGIVVIYDRFFFTCFVALLMFNILYKINSTCVLVAGFPKWKRVQY